MTSSGNAFWSGAKRPPHPLDFDAGDKLHMDFVKGAAVLRAANYGIKPTTVCPCVSCGVGVGGCDWLYCFRFLNGLVVSLCHVSCRTVVEGVARRVLCKRLGCDGGTRGHVCLSCIACPEMGVPPRCCTSPCLRVVYCTLQSFFRSKYLCVHGIGSTLSLENLIDVMMGWRRGGGEVDCTEQPGP